MSFRLTRLTSGTQYFVSVSAVDLGGNESACSLTGNGVAQTDFSVTPSGNVGFGNVNLGSFADQTFTVQNARGGVVSGTVSTSAPFSIVSGASFSLGGAGSTQAVTVRFTPTTAATASVSVSFSADGDTLTRLVTGTGTGTDTVAPTVAITSPASAGTFSASATPLTIGGTASDNMGVTQVTWSSNRGGSGTATGTTSWSASGIVLQSGSNVLTVTARDAAGNTRTATLTVAYSPPAFTDIPLGAQSTTIRSVHITELRAAINSARASRSLSPFAWTDPTLTIGSTRVRAVHLTELRTALNQAYQAAGRALPTYTDPSSVAGVSIIKAAHLNELRAAVQALP